MKPTVCRIVAYWPTQQDRVTMELGGIGVGRHLAAIVTAELPNGHFNLAVFDSWGNIHPRQDIAFVEHMETLSGYCSTPPALLAQMMNTAKIQNLNPVSDDIAAMVRNEVAVMVDKVSSQMSERFTKQVETQLESMLSK